MRNNRHNEFQAKLDAATAQVEQAIERYCACYQYMGSSVIGERLAEMGYPDYICAAAEVSCEVCDANALYPTEVSAKGSVSPEYLAAATGWLRVEGRLPGNFRELGWADEDNAFIPSQNREAAEQAGLRVHPAKVCYSFGRSKHELPTEAPTDAQLLYTRDSMCPTICVIGPDAYADPVNVLPEEICRALPDATHEWAPMQALGVDAQVCSTGGDGTFMGVAVDTGRLLRFPFEAARLAWGIPVSEEISIRA